MPTKLTLTLTALLASGATAAAIALPAIGDDAGGASCPKPEGGKTRIVREGPKPADLRACLRSKGLNPPDGDVAMKYWIGSQQSDDVQMKIKQCFIATDPAGLGKPGDVKPGDVKPGELKPSDAKPTTAEAAQPAN
jgi:hypothetical protein